MKGIPLIGPLKRLLSSSKGVAAIIAIGGMIGAFIGLDKAQALELSTLIATVTSVLIGAIAYEDAAEKRNGKDETSGGEGST